MDLPHRHRARIRRVTDAVGFQYAYDEESKQFAHAAALFVLTPDGRVSRYLYGIDFPPRDLRLALVEAGEGRGRHELRPAAPHLLPVRPGQSRDTSPTSIGFVQARRRSLVLGALGDDARACSGGVSWQGAAEGTAR